MASEIASYVANVGMSMLFGLGYYLVKKNKDKKIVESKQQQTLIQDKEKISSIEDLDTLHKAIKDGSFSCNQHEIINLIINQGFEPTIETFNISLQSSFLDKNYQVANMIKKDLFNKENHSKVKPNLFTVNILIKGLSSECLEDIDKDFDYELKAITALANDLNLELDIISHNCILNGLVDLGRQEEAWNHYVYLKNQTKFKKMFDVYTYTTLLKSIRKDRKEKTIKSLWIERTISFVKEGIHLRNEENYGGLICAVVDVLLKLGGIDEAESIFSSESAFFNKTDYIEQGYTILTNAYAKSFQYTKALDSFNKLKYSLKNNTVKSISKTQLDVLKVLRDEIKFNKEVKRVEGFPSTISYASILNACARTKNMQKAEEILREMVTNRIPRNPYIYSTMINGYRKIREFSPAFNLYLQIRENSFDPEMDEDLKLSQVIFNSMLDCCVECGEYNYMEDIFSYLSDLSGVKPSDSMSVSSILTAKTKIKAKIKPDIITYSIVIKGYAKANNINKVMETYNYLLKNFTADEVLYNTLLDCFAKNCNEEAFNKILDEMDKMGIKKSVVTYGVIMKLYTNQKNLSKALKLYENLIEENITPTVIIYQLLIKLYARLGYIDQCVEFYRRMCNNKVKPDSILTDFVLNLCCGHFRIEDATEICLMALDLENAIDINTLEFFIYGVFEEPSIIYMEKKSILTPIYEKVKRNKCEVLKNELETFLFNSNYDKESKYQRNKSRVYKYKEEYSKFDIYNDKFNYNANVYRNKNHEEEEEFFNADNDTIDFNDGASTISFRSQFKLKPTQSYYNKRAKVYNNGEVECNLEKETNVEQLFSSNTKEEEFDLESVNDQKINYSNPHRKKTFQPRKPNYFDQPSSYRKNNSSQFNPQNSLYDSNNIDKSHNYNNYNNYTQRGNYQTGRYNQGNNNKYNNYKQHPHTPTTNSTFSSNFNNTRSIYDM